MIGWGGGFISEDDASREWGYVPQNPDSEHQALEQAKQEHQPPTKMNAQEELTLLLKQAKTERLAEAIRREQQERLGAIINVLAHYENEETVAFKIAGVPITQELLIMIMGLCASSVLAVINSVVLNVDKAKPVLLCHGMVTSSLPGAGDGGVGGSVENGATMWTMGGMG